MNDIHLLIHQDFRSTRLLREQPLQQFHCPQPVRSTDAGGIRHHIGLKTPGSGLWALRFDQRQVAIGQSLPKSKNEKKKKKHTHLVQKTISDTRSLSSFGVPTKSQLKRLQNPDLFVGKSSNNLLAHPVIHI